jgi:hypothetical protein
MAKGLILPPYMVSKGLQDISKEGLAPQTTDSVLAAQGTDDSIDEPHLVPATHYDDNSGPPPTKQNNTKLGGLTNKAGT